MLYSAEKKETKIMFRNKYSLEYCYTLEELFPDPDNVDNVPDLKIYSPCVHAFGAQPYWTDKDGVGHLLWEYIYGVYRDHIAVISDEEIANIAGNNTATREFWGGFYTIWKQTHVYYEKLITLYASKETALLDAVSQSVENEVKFNDTPQNAGNFDTDNHTTNVSKTKQTSKNDAGTAMARLDEIRRRYTDLYKDWADRFDRLFISSLNYDKEVNDV